MFKLLIVTIVIGVVNLTHTGFYEILGVSKQASTQEIRQAYKKLAIKFHPDKTSDTEDQKKFIEITEAYETLKDPEKRKNYDLYGSFPSYTRQYDHRSQAEYNKLFYNGLYHEDPHIETLSGRSFYTFLGEGFHFVNFYSPFCPPCQNLVDHWKKVAELYKDIVKIGAVNCKYHNSFCYNSMRIGSYPSLLFYPNGKQGNYLYYRGERTFEALNQFLMSYISSRVVVPVVARLKSDDAPIAYVLGSNRVDHSALTRIAYVLRGLVTLVIVEDEDLRAKLTKDEYVTVVFMYKGRKIEIKSTEEKEVLKDIVAALPKTELVGPEKVKEIRNKLRSGYRKPWVLYFSSKDHDRLLFNQMKRTYPDMHFGEVDCSSWRELCASLQAAPPAWGVLKPGGAYQRAPSGPRAFLQHAPKATSLHTLSASDLSRILSGQDVGTWVLVVVPQHLPWEQESDIFTRVSLQFLKSDDINFGIMACTSAAEKYCRQVAEVEATVIIQRGRRRDYYDGRIDQQGLVDFIQLVVQSEDLDLDEQRVLEILDPQSRQYSWLVAFLPPHCGRQCHALAHQWRLVANKLRPLEFARVGMLQCQDTVTGFCSNIRLPTGRLYPIASGQHYTISLQELSQAPYIWEWALGLLDDSVQKLNWQTFNKLVDSEDLHPSSHRKPWLVYFHSPRCYRCYEMYADFAMAGIFLNNAVELGTVNCVSMRALCQHENVGSYPALRLYVPRARAISNVHAFAPADYVTLLRLIKPLVAQYQEEAEFNIGATDRGFRGKHDEF